MKIFFILTLSVYSLVAQNNLPVTERINNLFKMQKNYNLFYVQVGAFKNRRYAVIVKRAFEKKHYPLLVKKRKIGLDNYFKLLIGPFRSREEAYSIKSSLPKKYRDAFILTEDN